MQFWVRAPGTTHNAEVVELVDTRALETLAERRVGSSPTFGTTGSVVELADTTGLKPVAVWREGSNPS